ncbi:MAG TPA: sugar ABC transporter substrate-binding protein, partial [Microbacterium sp.]|nr:sugar ABC transporter substrate-binding protein [Microbacterium sp.]
MNAKRVLAGTAALALGAVTLAACSGDDGGSADGTTTLTLWHNSTTGPGQEYWENAAAAFEEANPGVTIEIQAVQNEDLDGKLQTALNAGDPPDLFLQRGGGKMTAMVNAGQLMDLTDRISDEVRAEIPEGSFAAETYQDSVWAMPLSVLPGGFWYSEDAFAAAGIESTPETIDDLEDAVEQLQQTDIAPIALGGKDAWPAAHWYYF